MTRTISPNQKTFLLTADGRKHRADVDAWGELLALRRSLGSSAPPIELPTAEMVRRPGELERVLDGIKTRFQLADQRHRENIDREVMLCMRLATLLSSSTLAMREILSGEWAFHWQKSDKDPSEALRFVFIKVHSCPKKASFYYRATRAFFEEGVKAEDLSRRVTSGGGYRALAKANVRFPRLKTGDAADSDVVDGPNLDDGVNTRSDGSSGSQLADHDSDLALPRRSKRVSRTDATSNEDDEAGTTLIATFEGEGRDFLQLPIGCYATVCLKVIANTTGRQAVMIYNVTAFE